MCQIPLGWLQEILDVLQPGGVIALVIPDHRRTFDYFRTPTTFSQVIGWSVEKPSTANTDAGYGVPLRDI